MKNSINMYDPSHTTVYCQLLNTVKSQFATAYWQIFTAYCQTFDALLLKHQRKKHYIYIHFLHNVRRDEQGAGGTCMFLPPPYFP